MWIVLFGWKISNFRSDVFEEIFMESFYDSNEFIFDVVKGCNVFLYVYSI